MFNLTKQVEQGLKDNGYRAGEIAHNLWDKNKHRNLHFDYHGARVERGTVEVFTQNKWIKIAFVVDRAWCTHLNIVIY